MVCLLCFGESDYFLSEYESLCLNEMIIIWSPTSPKAPRMLEPSRLSSLHIIELYITLEGRACGTCFSLYHVTINKNKTKTTKTKKTKF